MLHEENTFEMNGQRFSVKKQKVQKKKKKKKSKQTKNPTGNFKTEKYNIQFFLEFTRWAKQQKIDR